MWHMVGIVSYGHNYCHLQALTVRNILWKYAIEANRFVMSQPNMATGPLSENKNC